MKNLILTLIMAIMLAGCGNQEKTIWLETDDVYIQLDPNGLTLNLEDLMYQDNDLTFEGDGFELGIAGATSGGNSLTTHISSYRTLHSLTNASSAVDTDLAAASGYNTAVPSGAVDLLGVYGRGADTRANILSLCVHAETAADGDTLTQKLYGVNEGGAPQLLASIVWTIGTARADGSTATHLWADDAVITDTHITVPREADGDGSNRVCSVTLDVQGYRYVYGLFTAQTGDPTVTTCLYRVY